MHIFQHMVIDLMRTGRSLTLLIKAIKIGCFNYNFEPIKDLPIVIIQILITLL